MIALGSDHGGFNLKTAIADYLTANSKPYYDFGTDSTAAVDYPDIAQKVATAIINGQCRRGILICGTGIGIMIAANKIKGIRAAVCHDVFSAKMARHHNDANILALGERVVGQGLALEIIEHWLSAEFDGGRHAQRVAKIEALEQE